MNDTASAVRAELGRQGLPKTSLVPVLGLSYTAVHRRLTGDVDFTVPELDKVAQFLNVPITTLLGTALAGDGRAQPTGGRALADTHTTEAAS